MKNKLHWIMIKEQLAELQNTGKFTNTDKVIISQRITRGPDIETSARMKAMGKMAESARLAKEGFERMGVVAKNIGMTCDTLVDTLAKSATEPPAKYPKTEGRPPS